MAAPIEIVILGGNIGGVGAAHYLLRHTIPQLKRVDAMKSYHITLVTPNTSLFFKIASPRALINSTLIPETKIVRPLAEGFRKYNAKQFEIVQGIATSIDLANRSVIVGFTTSTTEGDASATTEKKLHYDSLLIATGTTSASALWTLHNDESLTTKALHSMHEQLPKAKTILVAGGGPVGIETSGEIASAFPTAKITLLSGGTRLLRKHKVTLATNAQAYLEHKAHVEVLHNVRVVGSKKTADGATIVELSDGKEETVDLYIDATAGVPNSGFLPGEWLDESKRVITADAYFRVRGKSAGDEEAKGVYVIGDVVAGSANTLMECDAQIPVACSALAVDAAGGKAVPKTEGLWGKFFGDKNAGPTLKEFKPMKDTIIVPVGRNGGVGMLFGFSMPSWFVKFAKGNKFLVELVDPMMSGEKWK
ncbi:hypothetical protein OCU04_001036 [Sclerotinia nivalis]|uniref:FAD/NAD(P)-binding domain-containing protein n=1 Tax=Sclerotinia nivalis TaxID=352851 RepID=A0A9X0DQC5_9HELO|nr:hypothetical protein OCU04_001036 [Sclerotinia nivalis]